LLNSDPIMDLINAPLGKPFEKKYKLEQIETEITGICADEKLSIISQNLKKNEAILITNLEEISYLCNLRDFSTEYSSKIEAKCLVKKDIAVLFSSGTVKNIGENFEVLELKDFAQYIENSNDINQFFVDKTSINAYDYGLLAGKIQFLKENKLKTMKSLKTLAEIEHYKKCFEKTDEALTATRKFIEQNDKISEYDITQNLKENFLTFGAKSLSFKPIVAKAKNSALAHYSKSSKTEILQDGSLVLIDCGAYYEGGYATDCTRVFVKGTPSELQKKVYTVVLKGFLKAFNKKITKNTTGFALDKAARKVLNTHKPAGFEFSHSLGHGIGIGVHESPPSLAFSPTAKTPLKPNMCFTIEPGLYKKTFGGVRLENSCYLAEENGKLIIKSFSNMCFEEKLIDFSFLTQTEKKVLKYFEVK
ncbi:MAG: M24 family metallopeptidase, partial [bacterium]